MIYRYLLALFILSSPFVLLAEENPADSIADPPESYQDNEMCLQCHGEALYTLYSSDSLESALRPMAGPSFIPRDKYYHSDAVHRSFYCTDCHSEEFSTFPHPLGARFEYMYECIDCHGGDETYAKYHFEDIAVEYDSSVHAGIESGFSCWSCHSGHSYMLHAREKTNISTIVAYNNNVCLGCHTHADQYQLISDKKPGDLIAHHDWLPNQNLHFKMVRCIDCHAREADSVMVAHAILPADQAVRKCEDCHSANSHLSNTLYKFMSMQERKERGFLNAVVINDSYMIGANRNIAMNWASAIIFLIVIGGVIFHAMRRIINSK